MLQTKEPPAKDFHWHIITIAILTAAAGAIDKLSGSNLIDPNLALMIGGVVSALLKYTEGH